MSAEKFLVLAEEAIHLGHKGPAHRHLLRVFDCENVTDAQLERWARLEKRLTRLELEESKRNG